LSLKQRVAKELEIQKHLMVALPPRRIYPSTAILAVVTPVLSVVVALLIAALILFFSGKDALLILSEIFRTSFIQNFSETVVKAIPLILAALGVALAFRARLWNIGAEGQFYGGVLVSTGLALSFPNLPAPVIIPLMVAGGLLGGAIWGLLPGLLRSWLDVNEIISSLMLNYVALLLADYFIFGPWKDPKGFNFPVTASFSDEARLPVLVEGTRIHFGLVFAIVAAGLVWLLVSRTKWGFELKVMGDNLKAARYAGINITRNIIIAFMVSGALAGLAGMSEVTGVAGRLQQNISPGYGYTAIIVAWLARLNPWAIILVAILFGGLVSSGFTMQRVGVSSGLVTLLQGIVLFCVLGGESLYRRLLYQTALRRSNQNQVKE
jgi:simple sugar transport system permease protein